MRLQSFAPFVILLLANQARASCGDGSLQIGEQCDDGNTANGDGCDSACKIQPYYRCDTTSPNVCKVNAVISLSAVGIGRDTSSNTAIFLFKPNYQLDLFKGINFASIFLTSVASSSAHIEYISRSNLIKATVAYKANLENTLETFQLQLTSTNLFWYDSKICTVELHGANCELTYHNDIELHNIFSYLFLALIIIAFGVGFASIFFEKWIGLELIQTYQSTYYILLLLDQYPLEFFPLCDTLRYSNGFDVIFAKNFERTYTLPKQLNGLSIQKQFLANINVDLALLAAVALVLVVLAIFKSRLKLRLQSQVNREINKRLDKVSKLFAFVFGQVFILLVLVLMFKIINSFAVQLDQAAESYEIFSEDINSTFAILAFLILFSVIFFIFNWYIMIPDNLTEEQAYYSLRFRNMKFCYPVIYLTYQLLFIGLISIYFHRHNIIYILLALQISYFSFILYLWPYNTPRKINRILHNATLLVNQFLPILMAALTFHWKTLSAATPQSPITSTEFTVYLFLIFGLLVFSTVLTVFRLCIFNKDVQCCSRQEEDDHEEVAALNENMMGEIELVKQASLQQESTPIAREESVRKNSNIESVSHFLNDKYSNWKRQNAEELKKSKSSNRVRKIKKTNSKLAELIKTPLDQLIERKLQPNNRLDQQ